MKKVLKIFLLLFFLFMTIGSGMLITDAWDSVGQFGSLVHESLDTSKGNSGGFVQFLMLIFFGPLYLFAWMFFVGAIVVAIGGFVGLLVVAFTFHTRA